jgi:hypothetical protein
MSASFYKETLGWGTILWFIGYALGFVFFAFVPADKIGWVIMPIGTLITAWIVWKKVDDDSLEYSIVIGAVWALLAILLDYIFLVSLLRPADGYYKLDVYLYYFLTFMIPVAVGWYKRRRHSSDECDDIITI